MKFLWNYIKSRLPLLLVAFCIITCAVASMVYAKYVDDNQGNASINITTGGKLTLDVSDPVVTGNNYEYRITNAGDGSSADSSNVTAYIRAAIVVNWQDSEGNLWAVPPVAGKDYSIEANSCTLLDGYYYYNGTCAPNSWFPISVNQLTTKPDYTLHVKILAEGIQSMPENAVGEAWGYTYQNGTWSEYTPN